MARVETWFKQDLMKSVPVRRMETVFNQDALGHLLGVEVYKNGTAVTLSGSVTGYCLLADGTTVPVAGTRSDNKAYIVLPQTAYSVIGPITVTVKLTDGSAITTLLALVGVVARSRTGQQVDPGSTVTDWTNQIALQLQNVQNVADNLGAQLASPFSTLTAYTAGSYVMYNGNLYRFTSDHAAGEWNSSHATAVKLGDEVTNLKSALTYAEDDIYPTLTRVFHPKVGGRIKNNDFVNPINPVPQTASGYAYLVEPCEVGDIFTITGTGNSAYRPWAIVDSEYRLTDVSRISYESVSNQKVIAPINGYLVCNFLIQYNYSVVRIGKYTLFRDDAINRIGLLEKTSIFDEMAKSLANTFSTGWHMGTFNVETGEPYGDSATKTIANRDFFFSKESGQTILSVDDGYYLLIYAWTLSGTYVGLRHSDGEFRKTVGENSSVQYFDCSLYPDYKFKVVIGKSDGTTTPVTDSDKFTAYRSNVVTNAEHIAEIEDKLNNEITTRRANDDTVLSAVASAQRDITSANSQLISEVNRAVAEENKKINKPSGSGKAGQILKYLGNDIMEWGDPAMPSAEQINRAVSAWLDEHPDATTTVPDHSLTYAKLTIGTLGFVTPEMYGAVGDGLSDDTVAIRNCLSDNSFVVFTKKYKISGGFQLHSNLHIYGFGIGEIIKDTAISNYYAVFQQYNSVTVSNVTISGLTIKGVKHWDGTSLIEQENDLGIRAYNISNAVIDSNRVIDCGASGIDISGDDILICNNTILYTGEFSSDGIPNYNFGIVYSGTNFRITNNNISGVIQGIISGLLNKNVVIANNDISTNGQHGMYIESSDNVVVIGNVVHDCSICGIKFQENNNTELIHDTFVIANNVIRNCGNQGILITWIQGPYVIRNGVVIGNQIRNVVRGIEISACHDICVYNNAITDIIDNGYGMRIVGGYNIDISGNKIDAKDASGIYFADGTYQSIRLTNNIIKRINTSSNQYFGIRLMNGTNIIMQGNTVVGVELTNDTDGVYFYGAYTYGYIIDNIIHGFRYDIRGDSASGIVVDRNYFDNGNGIPEIT